MRRSHLWALATVCVASPVLGTTLTINPGETVRLNEVANVGTAINDGTAPLDSSNRLFVVAQNGNIRVIQNGVLQPTAFMTPSNFTNFLTPGSQDERGLLGLAFHPDFGNSSAPGYGKFYTFSSRTTTDDATFFNDAGPESIGPDDGNFQNVLTEWTMTDPSANVFSGTSREVFSIAKVASNHNGGGLAFASNGNLYIAIGDGGDGNDNRNGWSDNTDGHTNNTGNAQDKNVAYGKILRINPLAGSGGAPYQVPADNPFVNADGLDEVYAYGLRNPFRISVDGATGNLYAGDVGQAAREEIDRIVSGGNYGWVNFEGTIATSNLPAGTQSLDFNTTIAPIAEYGRDNGFAVIGGYVNRGTSLQDELSGMYIFGDLDRSLFHLDPSDPNGQIFEFSIDPSGAQINAGINGFGQDQQGNLYVLLSNGRVLQMTPEPSSAGLMLLGFSALMMKRRNRR